MLKNRVLANLFITAKNLFLNFNTVIKLPFDLTKMATEIVNSDLGKVSPILLCKIVNQVGDILNGVINRCCRKEIEVFRFSEGHQKLTAV